MTFFGTQWELYLILMTKGSVEENNKDSFDDLQRAKAVLMYVDSTHFNWKCQSKELKYWL